MDNRGIDLLGGGFKSHNIFDEIISLENLFLAWREFKKGKSKKQDVQEFEFNLEDNIFQLHEDLKDKSYQHSPYSSFYVIDPKLRHIHKACVRDRVLHHAIFRIIYPIFDQNFIYDSYSCRIMKGTHRAVNRLEEFVRKVSCNNSRPAYALKCDIRRFFDSVSHGALLELITDKINDRDTIWLIEKIIKSFSKEKNRGLPLGNVTSQIFANIYLNELDQYAKQRLKARYYLRYCDDFLILAESADYLNSVVFQIDKFLNNSLDLDLHPNKIIIRNHRQGIDFLGYVVLPQHRVLRTKTKKRIVGKMYSGRIKSQALQSYLGVLKHCHGYKIRLKLLEKAR